MLLHRKIRQFYRIEHWNSGKFQLRGPPRYQYRTPAKLAMERCSHPVLRRWCPEMIMIVTDQIPCKPIHSFAMKMWRSSIYANHSSRTPSHGRTWSLLCIGIHEECIFSFPAVDLHPCLCISTPFLSTKRQFRSGWIRESKKHSWATKTASRGSCLVFRWSRMCLPCQRTPRWGF